MYFYQNKTVYYQSQKVIGKMRKTVLQKFHSCQKDIKKKEKVGFKFFSLKNRRNL